MGHEVSQDLVAVGLPGVVEVGQRVQLGQRVRGARHRRFGSLHRRPVDRRGRVLQPFEVAADGGFGGRGHGERLYHARTGTPRVRRCRSRLRPSANIDRMTATAALFLAGLALAVVIGLAAEPISLGPRQAVTAAVDRLAERVGPSRALVLVGAAASAGFCALGLLIGALAAALETSVDKPAFRWAFRQVDRSPGLLHHDWYEASRYLTMMGNSLETRALVVVASVVLAILWRRRRPWVPVVVIVGTYLVAYVGQALMTKVIDRGHPPAAFGIVTLGTFPSGGCLRIVAVWGIVAVLIVRTFPRAPSWFGPALAVFVAAAAWTEAYTRLYLLKHWLTDIIGGVVLGAVLLVLATALATTWIDRPSPSSVRVDEAVH